MHFVCTARPLNIFFNSLMENNPFTFMLQVLDGAHGMDSLGLRV